MTLSEFLLATILIIAASLVTVGFALLLLPLGFIVGGILLAAIGCLMFLEVETR